MSEQFTHLTHAQWGAAELAVTRQYLAPDFDPANPPTVEQYLVQAGFVPPFEPESLTKTGRFAVLAAAIRLVNPNFLEGVGPETRIKNLKDLHLHGDNFWGDLEQSIRATWQAAAQKTATNVPTYDALFSNCLSAIENRGGVIGYRTELDQGSVMPSEVRNFSSALAHVLHDSVHTGHFESPERTTVAHLLIAAETARASVHLDAFSAMPTWKDAAQIAILRTYQEREGQRGDARGQVWRLVRESADGQDLPLFALACEVRRLRGPKLKCPAHLRGLGQETALQNQLHGGINAAAERGGFDGPPHADAILFPAPEPA